MGKCGVFCRIPETRGWCCEFSRGFRSQTTSVGYACVLQARWQLVVIGGCRFMVHKKGQALNVRMVENVKMVFAWPYWVRTERSGKFGY